jgi:hypothetical protein
VVNTMLPTATIMGPMLLPGLQLEGGFIFAPANNDTTVRGQQVQESVEQIRHRLAHCLRHFGEQSGPFGFVEITLQPLRKATEHHAAVLLDLSFNNRAGDALAKTLHLRAYIRVERGSDT